MQDDCKRSYFELIPNFGLLLRDTNLTSNIDHNYWSPESVKLTNMILTALRTARIARYRACRALRAHDWELTLIKFGIDMTFNAFPTKAVLARFQTNRVIWRHV